MLRNFTIFIFILTTGLFYSQEGTRPLSSNLNYIYKSLKPISYKAEKDFSQNKTTANGSIELPFIEDFSYSPVSYYPDPTKWEDSLVYVNSGMANAPPSIGVATFDGLNKHGYPYDPTQANLSIPKPADFLTSKPINLFTSGTNTLIPTSDVALSFYYQARGKGDNPESSDSLLVDFYRPYAKPDSVHKPDTAWKRVWFTLGNNNSNTNDTAFKRVFIRITDTAYFHDGFKFRFRNWASVTGNFDHWHVDYIFLDKGRQGTDTIVDTTSYTNDVTFVDMPSSFLKDYSEMPRKQYLPSEMAQKISVKIRNNGSEEATINYKYRVLDHNNNQIFSDYSGSVNNLNPFWQNTLTPSGYGYDKDTTHSSPWVKDPFVVTGPKSAQFRIKHFISTQGTNNLDVIRNNDTVLQYQDLRNFYAFDDGSAEAGYYLNAAGAKLAVKIRLNKPDTLNGLRIYFDPVGDVSAISNTATTVYNFTIHVWGQGSNGSPSDNALILNDSVTLHPSYTTTGFKEVPEYKLKRPIVLGAGIYFIGIRQASSFLTIGLDRNYNHSSSLYYDIGSGWTQSAEYGSIMMQPVFGTYIPLVGINEIVATQNKNFSVYPNPASEQFTIRSSSFDKASYLLFNSIGQLVKEENILYNEQSVSTGDLSPGIYILILKNKGQTVQQQKIIVQH